MKTFNLNELTSAEIDGLLKRPSVNLESVFKRIQPVLNDVKEYGLKSALEYSKEFGEKQDGNINVSQTEFDEAEKVIDPSLKSAIDKAAANIKAFHRKQIPNSYDVETVPGVVCSREFRAIENIGLYIPGGTAVLFSTMLMLGIPASIAGCKRIIVCSPTKSGKVDPALLYSAKLCGVNEFYKIGGSQAIALMAYGDIDIPKADKIFGPGNQYVTAAKLLVSIDPEGCAIDMPAGPSEVLVVADENANPKYVASDLLSQAEHGIDSQSILVTDSEKFHLDVNTEIKIQLDQLERKDLAEQSLNSSFSLITNSIDEAIDFSNKYAPEHLILNINEADKYRMKIINAGSVFVGEYSPESAGDYASGTNHTLPTSGYSKMYSGLSVESYMKSITFQKLTESGLKNLSGTIIEMAEAEKLTAHANAVRVRL